MTVQAAEIVLVLAIGVGLGISVGPVITALARRKWSPRQLREREQAADTLRDMQHLREKLKVENKARELLLRSEGRIKGR